jgi:hypothetical protein
VKRFMVVCLLLPVLILTACSSFAQPTATPIPTPTFTAVPTLTATPTPTSTPLPPTETPAVASEWEEIPIMPGAVAGDGDEEGYVFTIQATPQQIQEYYELELDKLGWISSVQEAGDNSLILTFTNDASVMLTVSIIAKGDEALVLLVK